MSRKPLDGERTQPIDPLGRAVNGSGGELPGYVVVAAVSRGVLGEELAVKVLAEIDGLAVAATAFVGQHATVRVASNFDAGHTAAVGVFVGTRGVVGIVAKHSCTSC